MNAKLELQDREWHEVTGLTSGSKYYLQAKDEASSKYKALFVRAAAKPTDDKVAFIATDFKCKNTSKIWVKAISLPTVIAIGDAD